MTLTEWGTAIYISSGDISTNLPPIPPFFKTLSMKGLLKDLRKQFLRGTYSQFDNLLSRIANCELETAQKIRESWEELGIIAYDSDGLLVWYGEF